MRLPLFLLACLLLVACNSEQGRADFVEAMRYLSEQNMTKGMELLTKAAEEGNADAELTLGYFYAKGQNGLTQNAAKAQELFLDAAKHGNPDAQYNVGLAYVRGDGVQADYEQALEWFIAAAKQNDAGAQYNLGVMYLQGEGTEKDPVTAYAWFSLASENGYVGASDGMADARHEMTEEEVLEIESTVERIRASVKKSVVEERDTGLMPL
jgi:TPR repeat protein